MIISRGRAFIDVFPKATSLHITSPVSPRDGDIFSYLSRPDLRVIVCQLGYNPRNLAFAASLTEAVYAARASIQSLMISLNGPTPSNSVTLDHLLQGISASTNLQSLSLTALGPIPPDFLRALGRLPILRDLKIEGLLDGPDFGSRNDGAFPSLDTLAVEGDLRSLFALLSHAAGASLTVLRLNITQDHPGVGSLAAITRCINLRELELIVEDMELRWEDLQPILRCRSLQVVEVNCWLSALGVDDTTVAKMARAWSQLRKLKWRESWDRIDVGETLPVTLRGLEVFATHCPHLEHLEIAVDARPAVIPDGALTSSTLKPLLSLTKVNLGLSVAGSWDHLTDLTRTIDDLWPNLQTGTVRWKEEGLGRTFWLEEEELWDCVWRHLGERQHARKVVEAVYRP